MTTLLRVQTFRVFVYATSAPLVSFGFSLVVASGGAVLVEMNTLTATPRTRRAYDHRLQEQVIRSDARGTITGGPYAETKDIVIGYQSGGRAGDWSRSPAAAPDCPDGVWTICTAVSSLESPDTVWTLSQ